MLLLQVCHLPQTLGTIDFSDNYYKSDLVMVVKKGGYENATSIQDFSGQITAQLNTFHYTVIDQIDG